ncbi:MAG TPA: magnesium/cobalt transporter CorA [Candidatus Obscuribacterales bacterium]
MTNETNQPSFAIRVISYGPQEIVEARLASVAEIPEHLGKQPITWVDIEGRADDEFVNEVGKLFELHPLALEDVVHANQRAKVEKYGKHHFIVTRMVALKERLESEQLSIFFGKDFVVTFQDRPGGDCLDPVRERIRKDYGVIRRESADHLAYAILDAVVDSYFPVLDAIGEQLNTLQDEISSKVDRQIPNRIHTLKQQVWHLRKAIWPMRDALNSLIRDGGAGMSSETLLHLRDTQDHAIRIMDFVEGYRELCADLTNLHMSRESQRVNALMRILAIVSTIIMPGTLITGIYGMNFHSDKSPFNMPELNWYYGYPFALLLIVMVMGGLTFWLWWTGWLTGNSHRTWRGWKHVLGFIRFRRSKNAHN